MGKTTIQRKVSIKSDAELELMRQAGRIVAAALEAARQAVGPGVSSLELDGIAEQVIRGAGAIPSFKGYRGFPATLCTSINQEIVHGIPSERRRLSEGDLIKIDCGAIYRGWHGDAAITVIVGHGTDEAQRLVAATQEALSRGIAAARAGGHVSDIGEAIEAYASSQGFEVVREYCGHGVGRHLHEEPPVPNYGPPGEGPALRPGMVVAIEPMLNAGVAETTSHADGWTVTTADGKLSAHFEHTVAVTRDGPRILTLP